MVTRIYYNGYKSKLLIVTLRNKLKNGYKNEQIKKQSSSYYRW